MRRLGLGLAMVLALCAGGAVAQMPTDLRALATGDDSRGWEAVGRLNLGNKGFCTGTLIAPDLVLTAAHCLYDKETGQRITVEEIEFLAGWRNGRAAAYRGARRAVHHPSYVFGAADRLERVAYDLALIELDQPIRLPSIRPFVVDGDPMLGEQVGVVSYARERSEAPSLQEVCDVLGRQPGVVVLTCNVDFGSSGAPIFAMDGGEPRIVSVVSAKAEVENRAVALGTSLDGPLEAVRAELASSSSRTRIQRNGAKFLRP